MIFTLPSGLSGIVSIQTVYSGRELFAFEANVGGDDEEAEDIVIEREGVNYQNNFGSIIQITFLG